MKQETAAHLPAYKLTDPITIFQYRNIPLNLFRLRKELEKYGFHEWPIEIVYSETMAKAGKVAYAIGVPMQSTGAVTHEQFYQAVGKKLGVEPNATAIGTAFYQIIARNTNVSH